jgi:[ribosomal protein S5]-alanine N-acetyltransferase
LKPLSVKELVKEDFMAQARFETHMVRGEFAAIVETKRLLLRRLQPTDMDAYFERIYADPEVMRTLPTRAPITREEFNARIPTFMIDHWTQHSFGPWAVIHKADNEFIGHCGLRYWPGSSDVEVFYALDKRYWGKGLASEGAQASLWYGFEHLKLERIIAAAMVDNTASRRVLEHIGMRYTEDFTFAGLTVAKYVIARDEYATADSLYRLA